VETVETGRAAPLPVGSRAGVPTKGGRIPKSMVPPPTPVEPPAYRTVSVRDTTGAGPPVSQAVSKRASTE
jgi:hypothetical protein